MTILGSSGIVFDEAQTWGDELWGQIHPIIIGILAIVGAVAAGYAIFLGMNIAKATDEEKRKQAKGRMVKTVIGLFIVVILFSVMTIPGPGGGATFLESILSGTTNRMAYATGPVDFLIDNDNKQLVLYRDGKPVTQMGPNGVEFRVSVAGEAGLSVNSQGVITATSTGAGVVEFLFMGAVLFEEVVFIWPVGTFLPPPPNTPSPPPSAPPPPPPPVTPPVNPPPGGSGGDAPGIHPANGVFSHWPVAAARGSASSSGFAYISSRNRYHAGIDIGWGRASLGQSTNVWVYAAHTGVVSSVNTSGAADYWFITIRHEGSFNVMGRVFTNLRTNYIHVNDIRVRVGERVSGGQPIARVAGSNSFAPHLHFEVTNGGANNPPNSNPPRNATLSQIADNQRLLHPHMLYPNHGLNWQMRVPL
jgi:murein DD-endopeptidase MepM/ murein hydrolase activator NlpD